MKTKQLLLAFSLLGMLSSCGGSSSQESSPAELKELRIGALTDIKLATYGEYNYDILAASVTQLPLFGQKAKDGSFYPLLCDFVSTDASHYKFTVREGMKWHDGTPVTAEDILYTFVHNDSYENGSYLQDYIDANGKTVAKKMNSAVVSEDKKSITIETASPNTRFLTSLLDMRVMPKHIFEKHDDRETKPTEKECRIGCGPFRFASFQPSANLIRFEKADTYPFKEGEDTIFKSLSYVLYQNADTLALDFASGKLDLTWKYSSSSLAPTGLDSLGENNDVYSYASKGVSSTLVFNTSKAPGSDREFRQAVSYALDYELAKKTFGSSYAQNPNRSFVPSGTVGFVETEKLAKDEAKAKEAIGRLGYSEKDGEGYYVKDGKRLSFTLTVNSDMAAHLRYADFVKTSLKNAGIEVKIDEKATNAFRTATTNKFAHDAGIDAPTHEACILGFTAAGMDMMGGLGSIYLSKAHAVQGVAQIEGEEFERLIDALNSADTYANYLSAAKAMQEYYAREIPVVALYWDATIGGYSKSFSGIEADTSWGVNSALNFFAMK